MTAELFAVPPAGEPPARLRLQQGLPILDARLPRHCRSLGASDAASATLMERSFFMPAPRSSSPRAPRSAPSRRRANRGATKSGRPNVPPPSELETALDAALLIQPPADATFASLGLPKSLVVALAKHGIEAPFAIQTRAIPDALAGRDVLGRAQTGGGKTLAFGLPLLARLGSSTSRRTPRAPRGVFGRCGTDPRCPRRQPRDPYHGMRR